MIGAIGAAASEWAKAKVRSRTRMARRTAKSHPTDRIVTRSCVWDSGFSRGGSRLLVPTTWLQLQTPRASWNQRSLLEDILDCIYVMLPHVDHSADLEKLAALVEGSNCIPLKNQVARLLPGPERPRIDPSELHRHRYQRVVVKTRGLPESVRLLTHRDDVRSFSADGRWIGTSWGLARYRPLEGDGLEILQIPLGSRVTAFCDTPVGLFVGTGSGLYRVDDADKPRPNLVKVDLSAVQSRRDTGGRRPVDASQLLWWRRALWVSNQGWPIRYEPAEQTARHYGQTPGRMFVAQGTLWVGRHVLDVESDEFVPIESDSQRWELIGGTENEIWADVYVDDALRHRPGLVDRNTLEVRPLPFANAKPGKQTLVNGAFELLGEQAGRVWLLGAGSHLAIYDRATGAVQHVSRNYDAPHDKNRHKGPSFWRGHDDGGHFYRLYGGSGTVERIPDLILDGDRGPYFRWRETGDNRLLLGAAIIREWREDNLGFDDNSGMSHHIQDLEGGLFEIETDTLRWRKLGARADELCDFYVKRICFDDRERRAYVCTNGGVTVLSLPDCQVIGRITVSDGLPSNKVEDIVRIGDKRYFACELGDEDGGLAVQDVHTKLIQRLSLADGLKSNKIKRLRAEGDRLHILYGTMYGVRAYHTPIAGSLQAAGADSRVRTFASSILDTRTGSLADGNEVLAAPGPPDESRRLPYLGGAVLCDQTHGGLRFIGGTHGLVVVSAGATLPQSPKLAAVDVRPVLSAQQRQLAEAAQIPIAQRITLDRLSELVEHQNPFVRANALAAANGPVAEGDFRYTPPVSHGVGDEHPRVRATAVWLLSRSRDPRAVEPLRAALGDRDRHVKALAALALARRGVLPRLELFEEMLSRIEQYGNYPFGATSTVGVEVGFEKTCAALAPHADREVFQLLMKRPLTTDNYAPRQKIFAALGDSLRRHPEACDVLLTAYTRGDDPGPESNYGASRFAQEVFKHAGAAVLPLLHKALKSSDRVVRSNAARGCGAIKAPASTELLIAALDLESGLSRASIVWALGELRAEKALPRLASLYVDARNDERRRAGSGFRMAQAAAQFGSQFESIRSLDALSAEWDELKRQAPQPIDPRNHETLLKPQTILEAVRKIGPAASQEFYRRLAAEADGDARREAAARLAEGTLDDREHNVPILRHLMADHDTSVRAAAAVSLLLLGERQAEKQIVAWLRSPEYQQRHSILTQLERVENGRLLAFAREALEELAKHARQSDPRAAHDDTRLQRLLGRIQTSPESQRR